MFAEQRHWAAEERLGHAIHGAVQIAEALVGNTGGFDRHDDVCAGQQRLPGLHLQQALVMGMGDLRAVQADGFHGHAGIQTEAQHVHRRIARHARGNLYSNGETPPGFDGHPARYSLDIQPRRIAQRAVDPRPVAPLRLSRLRLPREKRNCPRAQRYERAAEQEASATKNFVDARPSAGSRDQQPNGHDDGGDPGEHIHARWPARQDLGPDQTEVGDARQRRKQVKRRVDDSDKREHQQCERDSRRRPARTQQGEKRKHQRTPKRQCRRSIEKNESKQRNRFRRRADLPLILRRDHAGYLQPRRQHSERQPHNQPRRKQPAAQQRDVRDRTRIERFDDLRASVSRRSVEDDEDHTDEQDPKRHQPNSGHGEARCHGVVVEVVDAEAVVKHGACRQGQSREQPCTRHSSRRAQFRAANATQPPRPAAPAAERDRHIRSHMAGDRTVGTRHSFLNPPWP